MMITANIVYTLSHAQQFNHFSFVIVVVIMAKIKINQKNDFVNVISSHGIEVEVDAETLARWNKAISQWWEVQLEMDKAVKQND